MEEIITVGELVISGEKAEGRYGEPVYVDIVGPENDEINVNIEKWSGDITLCLQCRYREAAGLYNRPQFRIAAIEGGEAIEGETAVVGGQILDETDFATQETYRRWDSLNRELRFKLDPSKVPIGEDVEPVVYRLRMVVILDLYDWNEDHTGPVREQLINHMPVSSFHSERLITVRVRALSSQPVWIEYAWRPFEQQATEYERFFDNQKFNFFQLPKGHLWPTPDFIDSQMPPVVIGRKSEPSLSLSDINILWGPPDSPPLYKIYIRCTNKSQQTIRRWYFGIIEQLISEDGIIQSEQPRIFDINEYDVPEEEREIKAGESKIISIGPFDTDSTDHAYSKDWTWFEVVSPGEWWDGVFSSASDYYKIIKTEKYFQYKAEASKLVFESEEDFEYPDPQSLANGKVRVFVSGLKKYALHTWARYEHDKDWVQASDLVVDLLGFIPTIGAAFSIGGIIAGLYVESQEDINDKYLQDAEDPIIFDPDYNDVHDYRILLTEIKVSKNLKDLYAFRKAIQKITAMHRSMQVTFARYLSALREDDNTAANRQIEGAEILSSLLRWEIIEIPKKLKAIEELSTATPEEESEVDSFLDDVRKEGLPQSFVDKKLSEGYKQEQIQKFEEIVKSYSASGILKDRVTDFERLHYTAMEFYTDSMELAHEIRKLSASSTKYMIRALCENGLITDDEMDVRLKSAPIEEFYHLDEAQFIEPYTRAVLIHRGICNTMELLNRCITPSDRNKLAIELECSTDQVLEWANRVDLMRVKDVSWQYADLLENVGVDTVVELSSRNPDHLFSAIKEYFKLNDVSGSVSLSQVKSWVEMARNLKRKLEY